MTHFSILFCMGELLYVYYWFEFLICGLLLLIAIIGAIFLSYSTSNNVKTQNIFKQLLT